MGPKESNQTNKIIDLPITITGSFIISLVMGHKYSSGTPASGKIKISGPEVIKLFSCSTQLSMKFQMLIQTKIPTN